MACNGTSDEKLQGLLLFFFRECFFFNLDFGPVTSSSSINGVPGNGDRGSAGFTGEGGNGDMSIGSEKSNGKTDNGEIGN
jgi:hypothetical protein